MLAKLLILVDDRRHTARLLNAADGKPCLIEDLLDQETLDQKVGNTAVGGGEKKKTG